MPDDPILVEVHERSVLPDGRAKLSCTVRVDSTTAHEVWMHVPATAAPTTDDWAAPLMVVPAMRDGRAVRIVGRVCGKLMAGIDEAQHVLARFNSKWKACPVRADQVITSPRVAQARGGSFFSAGLDSWYSALAGDAEDIVFGIGIDMRPEDHQRIALVLPRIEAASAMVGKPLTQFETNLRVLYYGTHDWGKYYQGAALACCAHALSGRYSRILIPATYGMRDIGKLWGSMAGLDPLWSSAAMELVHHGTVSRIEKARLLVTSDAAMATLRVCWHKGSLAYNCGECGKCLRTMLALTLVNGFDRCKTFDRPLDLAAIEAMKFDSVVSVGLLMELLAEATNDPPHMKELRALCANVARTFGPDGRAVNEPAAAAAKLRRSVGYKLRRESARAVRKVRSFFTRRGG